MTIRIALIPILVAGCTTFTLPTLDNRSGMEKIYSQAIYCDYATDGADSDLSICTPGSSSVAEGWKTTYCAPNSRILVQNETAAWFLTADIGQALRRKYPTFNNETWDSFVELNAEPVSLPPDLDLNCPYQLSTIDEFARLWEVSGPFIPGTSNSRDWPGPFVVFSQIGYDTQEKQAVVFVGWLCDVILCGHSSIYFLEKTRGTWVVAGAIRLVVY